MHGLQRTLQPRAGLAQKSHSSSTHYARGQWSGSTFSSFSEPCAEARSKASVDGGGKVCSETRAKGTVDAPGLEAAFEAWAEGGEEVLCTNICIESGVAAEGGADRSPKAITVAVPKAASRASCAEGEIED